MLSTKGHTVNSVIRVRTRLRPVLMETIKSVSKRGLESINKGMSMTSYKTSMDLKRGTRRERTDHENVKNRRNQRNLRVKRQELSPSKGSKWTQGGVIQYLTFERLFVFDPFNIPNRINKGQRVSSDKKG